MLSLGCNDLRTRFGLSPKVRAFDSLCNSPATASQSLTSQDVAAGVELLIRDVSQSTAGPRGKPPRLDLHARRNCLLFTLLFTRFALSTPHTPVALLLVHRALALFFRCCSESHWTKPEFGYFLSPFYRVVILSPPAIKLQPDGQ